MSNLLADEADVRDLYTLLIDAWNARKAGDFAEYFEMDGNVVGFDGSLMTGRDEIERSLHKIFSEHQTAPYVYLIKEVRFLTPVTALLRAIVGMVPPGKTELDPGVNAIQSLVATKHSSGWRISLFQNTPAQFHGHPELVQEMTAELHRQI